MVEDLENIRDSLSTVESHIFSGDERNMVKALSNYSHELIDFKQTARMHHDIWENMIASADKSLFGPEFSAYVKDIGHEFSIIHELIGNTRDLLVELRETNDSLLNTKQNQTMQVLTVFASIFYPLTFITDMLLIPSQYVPILGTKYDWWIILGLMILISWGMAWYFRRKKWM